MENNLEQFIGENEEVLWSGKPSKKCFILGAIFSPMLPYLIILFAVACFIFINTFNKAYSSQTDETIKFVELVFKLFFIGIPIIVYIGEIIFSSKKYKNTSYMITNKGVYITTGIFSFTYEMKPFTDLSHITIHRGIFDQWLGVGDVQIECIINSNSSHTSHTYSIHDIPDYVSVFNLIKKMQTDAYNNMKNNMNYQYNNI